MNPLGVFQLAIVAMEAIAYAVNPKLRKRQKKDAVLFGFVYFAVLLGGICLVAATIWSLYFR